MSNTKTKVTTESLCDGITKMASDVAKKYDGPDTLTGKLSHVISVIRSYGEDNRQLHCYDGNQEGYLIFRDVRTSGESPNVLVVDMTFAPKRVSAIDRPVVLEVHV